MPIHILRILRRSLFVLSLPITFNCQSAQAHGFTISKEQAIAKGLSYLRGTQKKNGSWMEVPAVTAVAVSAFLHNGKTERTEPAVARGIQYLLRAVKRNGAICLDGNPSVALPNYNTSMSVMALVEAKNPKYKPVIDNAVKYLDKSQFDEGEGIKPGNPMYGGIGYGDDPGDESHPDLSNLQTAMDALHDCGVPTTAPVFKKALIYLQRVQNRRESNDQRWVKDGPNDGGFLYESKGESKTPSGKHTSYGAMTCAGLKGYLYCGLPKSDPRVQAAWNWIRAHYTVTEHPNMGTNSLNYYYRTMSRTLDAYGEKVIKDGNGKPHNWARELSAQILSHQQSNGSWYSTNSRWWENVPDLITSYSLISLAYCAKNGG